MRDNPIYTKALYEAERSFRKVNGRMPDYNKSPSDPVVYLAGPMTGYPGFNFSAFEHASKELREAGFVVISPHEQDEEDQRRAAEASPDGDANNPKYAQVAWEDCLRRDLAIVLGVKAIIVLPGWRDSKGAMLETHVAEQLGLPIFAMLDEQGNETNFSESFYPISWPEQHQEILDNAFDKLAKCS